MNISELKIDRYGPLTIPQMEFDKGLEVVYGPNESGKTLLLEAILKFFDHDISSVMPEIERVTESPTGYIVVESLDGEEYKLGESNLLRDIAPIDTMHLRNIFVIRDNDLRLKDQHQFYNSVTEQMGDIHTTEIEQIQSKLEDLGRLTSTTRNISSAREYNDAGGVLGTAKNLCKETEEYIEKAQNENLDEAESDLIQLQTEMKQVSRQKEKQGAAKKVAKHSRLSDRLSTVRKTTDELDNLTDVSREELKNLNSLQQDIETCDENIDDLEEKIKKLESKVQSLEEKAENIEDDIRPLESREEQVEEVSEKLDTFRETEDRSTGAERWMNLARIIAILGIGFGGIATILGFIQGPLLGLVGAAFLGVGLVGIIWYYRDHRILTELEKERKSLLRKARDSNLEVESVSDIAIKIQEFQDKLEMKMDKKKKFNQKIEVKKNVLDNHRNEIEDLHDDLERYQEQKEEILKEAGLSNLEEYHQAVERKEKLQGNRSKAEQSLIDEFGEPDKEGWEEKIQVWEDELQKIITDVDIEEINPKDYDEETYKELSEKLKELEEEEKELQKKLEEHEKKVEHFKREVEDINARDFIEEDIRLRAKTIDGLAQLADDLERLISRIERDAEISREALEISDELHEEEEEKITELFEPGGRASQMFEKITDGRYQQVEYDPNEKTLKAHRENDQVRTTDELSRATREQLYLSTRISLAEQLLGGEPGFFLMDEAFLPADHDRLTKQFRILEELIEEGWQIIYLTAKKEVGEDMVENLDLNCRKFERLP